MTTETIFTAQVPSLPDGVGGTARQLGMKWSTSGSGKQVTGGRVWVPDTGKPTGMRWQLWQAPSTLLQDILLDSQSGTANTWMTVSGVTPQNITASQDYYVTEYIPGSAGGNYDFRDNGGPISHGTITATCTFRNGGTSNDPPTNESLTNFLFFADIVLEDAPILGTLALNVPALLESLTGDVKVSGSLALNTPSLLASLTGDLLVAGSLTLTVPALIDSLAGDVKVSGTLAATVPALVAEATGNLLVTGTLDVFLHPLLGAFSGTSASGDNTTDPCGWVIPAPLCCGGVWDEMSSDVHEAAKDYASMVLWAATGRQYGLCEVTVRPCGMRRRQDGFGEFWGYDWSGGTWIPYIFNGTWFNCGCGMGRCSCDPRCQVRLMGPVDGVLDVSIGGVTVDPSAYRVDDNHWLVRTDGDCWPRCPDMSTDDGAEVFTVTYLRGQPVPRALLRAASELACEWGKGCTGGNCRLSPRVQSLVRNGITIDMVDPAELLDSGLTGIATVDTIIIALNPYRNKQRLRIYAPELNAPRTVTSP